MDNKILIKNRFKDSIEVKYTLSQDDSIVMLINEIANAILDSLKNGGKLILAGNGGSYADAIHIAGEFVSRFMFDRGPLSAIALGSNNTIVTAIGNDYGYEELFCREFESLVRAEDVLICISTSGNSLNILKLATLACEKGIKAYGFTGQSGGELARLIECLKVPSSITARIQETHITVGHIICEIVESNMFPKQIAQILNPI